MSAAPEAKTCTKCDRTKPLESFSKSSSKKDGRQTQCKACDKAYYEANREQHREYQREYREATRGQRREYQREYQLLRKYKLTPAQYDAMLAAQGGGCAICGVTECSSGRAFAVDHDHACCPGTQSCGKCVRGLLCAMCNTAIGRLNDSPTLLRRAAGYLERA